MQDYPRRKPALLTGTEGGRLAGESEHAAVAMLFVAAAKADNNVSSNELKFARRYLAKAFSLRAVEARELMIAAQQLVSQNQSLRQAASIICSEFSERQRLNIFAAIENLLEIDGRLTDSERIYAKRCLKLLEAYSRSKQELRQ